MGSLPMSVAACSAVARRLQGAANAKSPAAVTAAATLLPFPEGLLRRGSREEEVWDSEVDSNRHTPAAAGQAGQANVVRRSGRGPSAVASVAAPAAAAAAPCSRDSSAFSLPSPQESTGSCGATPHHPHPQAAASQPAPICPIADAGGGNGQHAALDVAAPLGAPTPQLAAVQDDELHVGTGMSVIGHHGCRRVPIASGSSDVGSDVVVEASPLAPRPPRPDAPPLILGSLSPMPLPSMTTAAVGEKAAIAEHSIRFDSMPAPVLTPAASVIISQVTPRSARASSPGWYLHRVGGEEGGGGALSAAGTPRDLATPPPSAAWPVPSAHQQIPPLSPASAAAMRWHRELAEASRQAREEERRAFSLLIAHHDAFHSAEAPPPLYRTPSVVPPLPPLDAVAVPSVGSAAKVSATMQPGKSPRGASSFDDILQKTAERRRQQRLQQQQQLVVDDAVVDDSATPPSAEGRNKSPLASELAVPPLDWRRLFTQVTVRRRGEGVRDETDPLSRPNTRSAEIADEPAGVGPTSLRGRGAEFLRCASPLRVHSRQRQWTLP